MKFTKYMTTAGNMQLNKAAGPQLPKDTQGPDSRTLHNEGKRRKRQQDTTLTLICPPRSSGRTAAPPPLRSTHSGTAKGSSSCSAHMAGPGKQETNVSIATQAGVSSPLLSSPRLSGSCSPCCIRPEGFGTTADKTLPLGKGRGARQTTFSCFSYCQSESIPDCQPPAIQVSFHQ